MASIPIHLYILFLMSVVEDTGYEQDCISADRIMHRFGLHGQAIIPMVLGGCNVPAIMAIRQIGTKRERHIGLLITMVPCSAERSSWGSYRFYRVCIISSTL